MDIIIRSLGTHLAQKFTEKCEAMKDVDLKKKSIITTSNREN